MNDVLSSAIERAKQAAVLPENDGVCFASIVKDVIIGDYKKLFEEKLKQSRTTEPKEHRFQRSDMLNRLEKVLIFGYGFDRLDVSRIQSICIDNIDNQSF